MGQMTDLMEGLSRTWRSREFSS
ncbi:uncharacterized protein G2W53_008918 [Senna tora]|uniref:Uncharacterized protein n=1 Tax=Senna tora TaxID=362788 RepID=A0A835C776_9FABA|nr:uncharacterized protein G2W53_008918 [Senna tora]